MMIPPPEDAGDFNPGSELPCPECCSVWWLGMVTLTQSGDLQGFVDKVQCVNCEYRLDLAEKSEV